MPQRNDKRTDDISVRITDISNASLWVMIRIQRLPNVMRYSLSHMTLRVTGQDSLLTDRPWLVVFDPSSKRTRHLDLWASIGRNT